MSLNLPTCFPAESPTGGRKEAETSPPGRRLRIAVVTPYYPTAAEPYRGAPVWATLRCLSQYSELRAYCTMPQYLFPYKPRAYIYSQPAVEADETGVVTRTSRYWTVPWLGRPWNGRSIYRSLRASLCAGPPDLLLAYCIYPDGYAGVILGRELGIPVVVGSRGSDLRLIPSRGVQRRVQFTLANASAVLCVSSDLRSLAQQLGAPGERLHVIRNGVDSFVFRHRDQSEVRGQLGFPPETRLALYVGRLVSLKGLENLLDAIAILTRHHGQDWTLALAGRGPLEAALRTRGEELGVSGRTLFLGALPPEQVAQWMNAADLLCLPSASEGCPNVVLEALSCGRPVVATAVGGIPEIIDASCGVLIKAGDPQTLAQALTKAYQIPWNRKAMARAQLRDWDQVARETYEVCLQTWTAHAVCHRTN